METIDKKTVPINVEPQEPEGLDPQAIDLGAFPIDSLMIRTETRSVFEIVRRIDSGQYIMDPDFQRDFVWEIGRQSKLIESAILRIPLPVFYLAETLDGRIVVVDGLQRLTTFHRFMKGDFALTGLAFANQLEGKHFNHLPPSMQNRLEDTPLTLYLIDAKVPESAKYEIFERVNSGIPLTRQQMRNCLFIGESTRWLARMATDEAFILTTMGGLNSKTMRDRECINRFAGFHLFGYEKYDGRMEDFLNETLRRMNNSLNSDDYVKLSVKFRNSMEANMQIFGRHAFRKTLADPANSWGRSVINVALFDVFSTLLAEIPADIIKEKAVAISSASATLIHLAEFNEAISRSTNSTRNVQIRFTLAEQMLQKALE
jgi:hypothetical protein